MLITDKTNNKLKENYMIDLNIFEIWFVTGSQHLYGSKTLEQVAQHSKEIASALDNSVKIPVRVIFKPIVTTPDSITSLCKEANNAPNCIGLITWMHTFSPAKMWIAGLKQLQKPFVHLHTQFNRDIPYADIDMDFMNLNQSAHGGREFGHICTRMEINRKVIVGHWKEESVHEQLNIWMRAAAAWADAQGAKVARFGDNMREVAVTEGDKVEAQIKFGYSVNGYGIGDLVNFVNDVANNDIERLVAEYNDLYNVAEDGKIGGSNFESVREQARIEIGLRNFLVEGDFKAFTTTFEDLYGLKQLPGLAVQRLMAEGYGFGAEGDWKTAALVRAMKVMGTGLKGGTSFMEDYTYHLDPSNMKVLGAHMLEICPSIAIGKPKLEVHQLGIGGKDDPARLVFDTPSGAGINASLIDMGNRFRMVVNEVDVVTPDQPFPKLPVARVIWKPKPNLEIGAAAWIYAGAAHHSGFSQAITAEYIEDWCNIAGIECLFIDDDTKLRNFKQELHWNKVAYK
jgi:L-arabinose isomerase